MTTKIDELLNGGISNEGVVGRKIGQLFRRALKIGEFKLELS